MTSILKHGGTATNHESILGRVRLIQADVGEQLAGYHQFGQPFSGFEIFPGHGWVVDQSLFDVSAKKFIPGQLFTDELPVNQFGDIANAMGNNYLIESFVNRWVLNDAYKGSDTRAGAYQV